MSDSDDPHAARQKLVARLVDLQQEMASDPGPETRAQLLQTRQALQQFDEMRHAQRSRSGGTGHWFRSSRRGRGRSSS
jgi:antitoxin (DNA-binding transcriptional repressor) of toxin-antitoxin stability system